MDKLGRGEVVKNPRGEMKKLEFGKCGGGGLCIMLAVWTRDVPSCSHEDVLYLNLFFSQFAVHASPSRPYPTRGSYWSIVCFRSSGVVVKQEFFDALRTESSKNATIMAEDLYTQALEKIRQYATDARHIREQEMDVDVSNHAALESRLDLTIRELQERLKGQQSQLERVGRNINFPSAITNVAVSYDH
jgi:hypothetical protein